MYSTLFWDSTQYLHQPLAPPLFLSPTPRVPRVPQHLIDSIGARPFLTQVRVQQFLVFCVVHMVVLMSLIKLWKPQYQTSFIVLSAIASSFNSYITYLTLTFKPPTLSSIKVIQLRSPLLMFPGSNIITKHYSIIFLCVRSGPLPQFRMHVFISTLK